MSCEDKCYWLPLTPGQRPSLFLPPWPLLRRPASRPTLRVALRSFVAPLLSHYGWTPSRRLPISHRHRDRSSTCDYRASWSDRSRTRLGGTPSRSLGTIMAAPGLSAAPPGKAERCSRESPRSAVSGATMLRCQSNYSIING